MTVFFTSDLHIGHRLVAHLRWNALGHQEGVDDETVVGWHDAHLAQGWDDLVDEGDQIWVLGDISAGGTSSQRKALEWLSERPGNKHLIAGNHDGCHPMHRDSHKWQAEYLGVFDSVQSAAVRKVPTGLANPATVRTLLSHFPYMEHGQHIPDRFTQWWLPDEGVPILHGHVHSDERVTFSDAGTQQIHVGLDAWDLKPVSLEQITELL